MSLRSLFVDFNSFFASVEQQLEPKLRKRPVAVVPVMADTTCCIAASYEAKRFGVKTGTRVSDARMLCPEIQFIEARPGRYVEFHHQLVETVESCMHVSQVCSIDEMACELTGRFQKRELAEKLAYEIKEKISKKVGEYLKSSIGIAPNKFLSKTASDMKKPDGLTIIELKDLPQCLYRLELRDFCGIGPNMEVRLRRAGIRTVEMLCQASSKKLRGAWGSVDGERLYAKLRGEDIVDLETKRTTVGHSHVLPPEKRNDGMAHAILHRLLQKAALRLRKLGYYAGGMQIDVKYDKADCWMDERRFFETQDTLEFIRIFQEMWKGKPALPYKPLKVGVTFFRLLSASNYTPSLFAHKPSRQALNNAVDALNERFGKNAVYFGGAHQALDHAPMRIAFTRIPDPETEGDEKKKGF